MNEARAETGPSVRLDTEIREGIGVIATLTIDNPKKLNVMNSRMIASFLERIDELREIEELRVAIVTGSGGRAFVGGADIAEMAGLDADSARAFIEGIHDVCAGIRDVPVPVIARIDGHCYGAGLEMAAACDFRAASEGSAFGMPEVRVGVPSVVEAALLPGLIGWGKTRELLLTGDTIDADEAMACGFVQRVVPAENLDGAVERWVASILESGPEAVRMQKALIREWEKLPLDEAVRRGVDYFQEAFSGPEPSVFMQRFLERKR